MPSVELADVSKRYGNIAALGGVSLHVEDKEYVCVLGPSGCGKSTLIKCIAGIIQPESGQILIDGESVQRMHIEDRKIGYVFQEIALFPHMAVKDNVSYGLVVRGAPPEQITKVTNEILDLMNIRQRSRSFPSELSGGAQQKVALGRAIATGSHLFLLDEPLGALDALVRSELRYELKRLALDLGLTVIHVTHDQEEALAIADRVVVMRQGKVIEIGKPADVYLSPKSLFTQNFVGESNLLDAKVVETDGVTCMVDIEGRMVKGQCTGKTVGQRVVVAVRPEFIILTPSSHAGDSKWKGRINQATFLGSINRYVVQTEDGPDLLIHVPTSAETQVFSPGDQVDISLQPEHMLLFEYPTDGLETEIALE